MNQITGLTTLALTGTLILGACRNDSAYHVSVLKNGIPWETEIWASPSELASGKAEIFIQTADKEGDLRETLLFYKVPTQIGKYSLSITDNSLPDDSLVGCFFTYYDKDESHDGYLIRPGDMHSSLEITSYNAVAKELQGKFSLILWSVAPGSWNAPDSVVFSEGVFRTRIED